MKIYHWEIMGNDEKRGTVRANSESHAKRLARKASGRSWGKKWKVGWNIRAIGDGLCPWIGDDDYEPYDILWVYLPKEETNESTANTNRKVA